ncbi:MAG: hypothetical protein EZS28_001866 [Streblomastix strix]|uniref:Uncharacterized protein n=1 Tax=Streblomastix strix TaxID=222440 RepID=A0A5J4X5V4_9EUKA|nr:MAG: hypothetical protein EZS28_001866 [Streblomastix strix]
MNVNYVPPSAQGQHAFRQLMYYTCGQQHDSIRDQNLITAGNAFLRQQTIENVGSPSVFLKGSLAETDRTLGYGFIQNQISSPAQAEREGI